SHKMLTREQLISGKHVGVYKNEEPLKGYKTVNCPKLIPTWFGEKVEYKQKNIELTIPVGATIVRSECRVDMSFFDDDVDLVNPSLSTDRAIVTKMPTNYSHCYSLYDPYFSYSLNKSITPKNFSKDLYTHDLPGIHFAYHNN